MYEYKDKVMVYDVDYQGVSHYAAYYRYFTDAIESYKEEKLGFTTNNYSDAVWFVVVESKADYHESLHLNEEITVGVEAELKSPKTIKFNLKIFNKDKTLCTEGYLIMSAINPKIWKSTEVPKELVDKINESNKA